MRSRSLSPGFRFGTGLKGIVMRAGDRTVRTLLLSTGIDLVIGEESPFFIIGAEYGYPIVAGIVTQGGERKTHSRSSFRTQEKHASISPYSIHSDNRASMQECVHMSLIRSSAGNYNSCDSVATIQYQKLLSYGSSDFPYIVLQFFSCFLFMHGKKESVRP